MIDKFDGEYAFLSNFFPVSIDFEGLTFQSSEAAYQAAKTLFFEQRKAFTLCSASKSKILGRKINLRADWEKVKDTVMMQVLKDKFSIKNPALREQLAATGDEELVEGNHWHDNYWGLCSCEKCMKKQLLSNEFGNKLGEMLMNIRKEILEEDMQNGEIIYS